MYILKQVPNHSVDVPREIADKLWREAPVEGIGITEAKHYAMQASINEVLDELASSDVIILDPAECLFLDDGKPRVYEHGHSLYRDKDHVSDAGSMEIIPVLRQVFTSLSKL